MSLSAPAPVGTVPPLPPRGSMRLALLLGFHAALCLRSHGGPEQHRPPGGSERRLPAACWRALAVVDDREVSV